MYLAPTRARAIVRDVHVLDACQRDAGKLTNAWTFDRSFVLDWR